MRLAQNSNKAIEKGYNLAIQQGHELCTTDHIMWGLLQSPEVQEMFSKLNIDIASVKNQLLEIISKAQPPGLTTGQPQMTQAVKGVLHSSMAMAVNQQKEEATVFMLLLSTLDVKDSHGVHLLSGHGITSLAVKSYVSHGKPLVERVDAGSSEQSHQSVHADDSPLLRYASNLNERAKSSKIDTLIGREYEIHRTAQILSRRRKNNPLLVGEPGVGKTAIAEGLAKMIAENKAPEALKGKTIWSLNMGSMVAGTKYRGDFEQRIKDVLDEVKADPNIILFIDEIHTVIGAGGGGNTPMDASNIIKPALASGEMKVIGATTFDEYREFFQKEKALDRRFQKVDVIEPTAEETVAILKGLKSALETHHHVKYTRDAIESAVALSVKFMTDRFLPDKAIDLLDEAGAAETLKSPSKRHSYIDKKLIEEAVAKVTRLPVAQVSSTEKNNLKNLGSDLKAVVFGQDAAIDKLASAVCIAKAGLNDGSTPLGSFLFMGPTGVGKTEVVKQLSKSLGIPLLRFDMSEYMEAHSVAGLIGAPPGYIGHDKGGALTDAVFKSPHSVVLLDEIEKAHPDVFNLLLQVFDHGALTDRNGRTINFKNTIIVMTSNVGAVAAQKNSIGFVKVDQASEATKVMEGTFAPEFRNRLDAIVSFNPLGTPEIKKIVDKNIRQLEIHLENKGVVLELSEAVREDLAKEGFVPSMGARPMARLIQEKLKKPLAEKILFGDLEHGGKVSVDSKDGVWEWTIEGNAPKPEKLAAKRSKKIDTPDEVLSVAPPKNAKKITKRRPSLA